MKAPWVSTSHIPHSNLTPVCPRISMEMNDDATRNPLVQGADGSFYGTTGTGDNGTTNSGTMFKITTSGQLTTLYNFAGSPTDGAVPLGVIKSSDGNFYGVTDYGGTGCVDLGCGTFFRATPQGVVTVLYNFCAQTNCPDGIYPRAVIQAADGDFYGTTFMGGASDQMCGTVFKITSGGDLTTLHKFNHSDGCQPLWGLIQGSDGSFYGTTTRGGSHGTGSVFRMNAAGELTGFYSFC